MATYLDLRYLYTDTSLLNKLEAAVIIKAHGVMQEASPPAERLSWAEAALAGSLAEARKMLKYVLAANKDLAVAAIQGATDAAIQTQVDAAVDKLHPAT